MSSAEEVIDAGHWWLDRLRPRRLRRGYEYSNLSSLTGGVIVGIDVDFFAAPLVDDGIGERGTQIQQMCAAPRP